MKISNNNYIVFDTETISLQKPFIYNIGYAVYSPCGDVLVKRNLIVRQIWENKPLFATAYYATKRPLYTAYMKGRTAQKTTWGNACRIMLKDIKTYGVECACAYNANFDYKAFAFTQNFFHNKTNPLDYVQVVDILPYAQKALLDNQDYRDSFEGQKPNCKVQSVYPFLFKQPDYQEEHTALSDSLEEGAILQHLYEKWEYYTTKPLPPILGR